MSAPVKPSSMRRAVSSSGTGFPGTRSPTVSISHARAARSRGCTVSPKAAGSVSGMWKDRNSREIPISAAVRSCSRFSSNECSNPGYNEIPFAKSVIVARLLDCVVRS